jgi:hypothetical protein
MAGRRDAQTLQAGAVIAALLGGGLLMGGCSTSSLSSMTGGLIGSSPSDSNASSAPGPAASASPPPVNDDDVPCPDTAVRNGATTLIVGSTAGQGEPSPLDVRYQGSIGRIDRECHVIAGMMHIKVGVEGRVITGPAGGPGNLSVPLRVAVVQEGINPVTITTQLDEVPVTINNMIDHVTFTHIYPDVSFPLPHPLGRLENYKVYIGFDPIGAQQKKRRPPRKRR